RPHVPADRRVLMWTSPGSSTIHDRFSKLGIGPDLQARIYQGLLRATSEPTRDTYGAGLLRYHQLCDRYQINEGARMPADRLLLAAFIADALGTCGGKCIRNWLNGLRLWHLFNDAEWNGDEGWLPSLKKAGDRAGVPFKRPPRGPITKKHLRALRASLTLSTGFGAAAWANATSCFWGCRRMGELVLKSANRFSTEHDTCRDTRISFITVNTREVVDFHLFAFREHGVWRPLVKDHFKRVADAIFITACLEAVFGHSYRIGGSVELLLAGVEPEVIMKLGGWTSLCFLMYWRRLEQIIPDRITSAWQARMRQFASGHGHPFDSNSLDFDRDE
ncbi:hypothetical protein B0H15DRAFT_789038, partial [Mycena belliarum]